MKSIGVVLLVCFLIVCVLSILLVMVQDDGKSGMGGLAGGRGTEAFGSHSANVLTRATGVLVVLFFVLAFLLALFNKKPKLAEDLQSASGASTNTEQTEEAQNRWWESETDAK